MSTTLPCNQKTYIQLWLQKNKWSSSEGHRDWTGKLKDLYKFKSTMQGHINRVAAPSAKNILKSILVDVLI